MEQAEVDQVNFEREEAILRRLKEQREKELETLRTSGNIMLESIRSDSIDRASGSEKCVINCMQSFPYTFYLSLTLLLVESCSDIYIGSTRLDHPNSFIRNSGLAGISLGALAVMLVLFDRLNFWYHGCDRDDFFAPKGNLLTAMSVLDWAYAASDIGDVFLLSSIVVRDAKSDQCPTVGSDSIILGVFWVASPLIAVLSSYVEKGKALAGLEPRGGIVTKIRARAFFSVGLGYLAIFLASNTEYESGPPAGHWLILFPFLVTVILLLFELSSDCLHRLVESDWDKTHNIEPFENCNMAITLLGLAWKNFVWRIALLVIPWILAFNDVVNDVCNNVQIFTLMGVLTVLTFLLFMRYSASWLLTG